MSTKVSVIVPVYNTSGYLRKCIDSLIDQSISDDYEIIIIDDGSTDGSAEICDYYSEIENIYVLHKENGGLSDARNRGIEEAHGDYLTFVDSDDYVEKDYLKTLCDAADETGADMVVSSMISFHKGDKETLDRSSHDITMLSKSQCYRKMLLQDQIDVSAVAKLYKRDIWSEIRFVKGQLYEDINIIDKVVERTEGIAGISYSGYHYLQRKGSIMYSSFDKRRMSLIEASERIMNLMRNDYPENVDAAEHRCIYSCFHLLGRSVTDRTYDDVSRSLRNRILAKKQDIFNDSLYSIKERMATMILMMGLNVYRGFWKIYKRGQI